MMYTGRELSTVPCAHKGLCMVVVANAVATRVFFGVYKIQKSLLSHAPFPIRVNHATAYPMGKHDGQRKWLQTQSEAGLGTEGEGRGQPPLVGAEFRSIWRPLYLLLNL